MFEKIEKWSKELKTVDYKLLSSYQEGFLGKKVFEVTLANGDKKICERLTKKGDNGDAVVILPITKEGKFLLEVQSRPNVTEASGVSLEFPAGMVDPNEDPKVSAIRELREETGYEPEDIKLMEWHHQDQGCSSAIIRLYLATGCEKKYDVNLGKNEEIEALEIDYEDVVQLIKDNKITDSGSKLAFLMYEFLK